MFGKKEEKSLPTSPDVKVTKMPEDFYAGVNPVVKFETVEKIIKPAKTNKPVLPMADKKLLDKQTAVGSGNKLHPINLLANWKFLMIIGLIILVVGIGGFSAYYYWQYQKTTSTSSTLPPPELTIPEVSVSQPVVEPTSSSSVVSEPAPTVTPTVNTEAKIDFPSILLGESLDTDKDQISDVAEELFNTDPALPDTDGDKYPDGHEVYYLYNPSGKEPMKLIDSGSVSVYNNPNFLYELYYPKSWAIGKVDSLSQDVLFSTITGENIEVRAFDLSAGDSFESWFATHAGSEQLSDYTPFSSVFKESGWSRKDGLVYFILKNNKIFGIFYHTTDSNIVNYKIVITMMARSFQFGNSTDLQTRVIEENQLNTTSQEISTTTIENSFSSSTVSSTI